MTVIHRYSVCAMVAVERDSREIVGSSVDSDLPDVRANSFPRQKSILVGAAVPAIKDGVGVDVLHASFGVVAVDPLTTAREKNQEDKSRQEDLFHQFRGQNVHGVIIFKFSGKHTEHRPNICIFLSKLINYEKDPFHCFIHLLRDTFFTAGSGSAEMV
jgi:hypothetical protein